jgi:hypothetical protein
MLSPFPFNWIAHVRMARRITSIISASANNEISYKARHESFKAYAHTSSMTKDELRATVGPLDGEQMSELLDWTGGVPLYVSRFRERNRED